jgi:hypothetical protein
MSRFHVALLLCASLCGCQQLAVLGFILGGPPSIEPEFDKETGQGLDHPDKTVAVVCYADPKLKLQYPRIDAELAARVAHQLALNKIKVREPEAVNAWIDQHPDWELAEEVGKALDVDYVIEIEMAHFDLYEGKSTNLYRGRTEAYVNVHEIAEGGRGERIFSKELDFEFPTQVPRSAYDQTLRSFQTEYMSRLSEKIGWMFYARFTGDLIPWAS